MLLLLGCTAPDPAGDTAPVDTAGGGAPDPSAYDCTAAGIPARVSPIDPGCAVDRTCTERLVSGHRGMGAEQGVVAPENTLAAVRAAIAYGVDFVETDPRPTADDVIVNMHDTTVDRTTDGTGTVDELSYAEIAAMSIRADAYPGDFSCEHVPTLQEVLTTAKGRVHVLLDANKTDRVDLLVAAVQETDTLDEAIFDTSSPDKIAEAIALEPALHTMIRVEDEAGLTEQLATFVDHPPVIVEVSDDPALIDAVRAAGHRPLTDVFVTDAVAAYAGDPSFYGPLYDEGLLVLDTDRADLVLAYLGR